MSGIVPFNRRFGVGFEDFYNKLDDYFSDIWFSKTALTRDTFKLDVQEKESEYLIEAELPGIKKEEINLVLDDGRLSITVKREDSIEEERKNYIHRERRFSSMQRSIYLADAISEGVKAKLSDGVLSITVPRKVKKADSSKIEIE
ncbi:MAG: Hsp20/alpha crystallin family protein [Dethiobacteria bacterium]|jgi:HSP20 family protein